MTTVATYEPGSDEYQRGTSPKNAAIEEHPVLVAVPEDADQLAECVALAAERSLTVVLQATGHGAGGTVDGTCLLVDTSRLAGVDVDPDTGTARVGSGAQWAAVNAAAEPHGLLGRSGSAPDVGVSGYTFGGGAGWLIRPFGLASGALTAVDYVDGSGALRRAHDGADDQVDRDAIFAFRGGGGVGAAVSLEFGLVAPEAMWAGMLLWPADQLEAVVGAWAGAIPDVDVALSTSIGVLTAPPAPGIPDALQGKRIVHVAMASCAGEQAGAALREALTAAAKPAVDTWGATDAKRLSTIHLDPPTAVPGIGVAHWLDESAPSVAAAMLGAAAGTNLNMVEIRHVDNAAEVFDGALVRPPAGFMMHAVGADPGGREAAFRTVLDAARPADTGISITSWVDGAATVPDGLDAQTLDRIRSARAAVDPNGVFAPTRETG